MGAGPGLVAGEDVDTSRTDCLRKEYLMTRKKMFLLCLVVAMAIGFTHEVRAEWEIGVRMAFDSNVNRAINNEDSDFLATTYAAYSRQPSGETRMDWTLRAIVEGTAYADYSDLNYAAATISPGINITINPQWSLNIAPFAQAKGVSDSDQSAIAYGVRAGLKQTWNKTLYTGQYYTYTDHNANEDVYSYSEHAVGVLVGVNWTPAFFTEVGYEYSHGDSFRTVSTSTVATTQTGRWMGQHRSFSQSYNADVYSETVDRNAVSVNLGYDFTKSLFTLIGYTFTREEGDFDTLNYHAGFIGLGYRF